MADQRVVRPVTGVNYFNHQFLRTEDFEVAQDFHVDRLRQHDATLHRPGVVRGLQIIVAGPRSISISSGVAVDPTFHEVEVDTGSRPFVVIQNGPEGEQEMGDNMTLRLDTLPASNAPAFVTLRRETKLTEPTKDPMVRGEETRIVERARLEVSTRAPEPNELVLAEIARNASGEIEAEPNTEITEGRSYATSVIADGEVTTPKIRDRAVTSEKVAENAITTFHLAADAVLEVDIRDRAVTEPKLHDDAVSNRTVQRNAIRSDELGSSASDDRARAVGTDHIKDRAVTSAKIERDSIATEHLRVSAVDEGRIRDRAVTRRKIAEDSVDEVRLADDAVTGDKLREASVGLEHLTDEARFGLTVRDNGIDSAKLAEADGLTAQDSNRGTGVKTPHLQDEAVTLRKLALEARFGIAGGFLLFDGIRGVVISHANVLSVRKRADRAGHYLVTWRDSLGIARFVSRFPRPGVELLNGRLSSLLTRTSFARADVTALADAISSPVALAPRLPNGDGDPFPTDDIPPTIPGGLRTTSVSATQVNLAWTRSTDNVGVTGYLVSRDGSFLRRVTTTAFTDATVAPAREYTYAVAAIDGAGNVSDPASLTVRTPDTIPPEPPSGLNATDTNETQVDLSWTAARDNVGVTGYRVIRNSAEVGRPTGTSFSDRTVQVGQTYRYTVVAVDAAGNVSPSSGAASVTVRDRTPPSRPTSLTGGAVGPRQVNLRWNASTDNVGVVDYEVLRAGERIATVTAPAFTDTTVEPRTGYVYTVVARDAAGNRSEQAAAFRVETPADAPPPVELPPPTGLTGAEQEGAVALEWKASPDDRVIGYIVIRDDRAVTTVPETRFRDTGVRPGTVYTYVVRALDRTGGTSGPSNAVTVEVIDRTPPSTPTSLTATVVSDTHVNLSWTPSNDDVAVTGYLVFRNGVQIGTPAAAAFSDTDAPPGTTIRYDVRAVDAAGNRSEAASTTVSTTDTVPPSAPTNLRAALSGTSAVRLTWNASTDNVGVTGYLVFRDLEQIATVSTPEHTDADAGPGEHEYFVTAVDGAGNVSASSARVRATIPDVAAPSVPGGLRIVRNDPGAVEIAWEASTDNVRVTGYRVYRDLGFLGTTTATSFVDTAAPADSTVRYTVTAFDPAGNESAQSAPLEVRTRPPAEPPDDIPGPVFAYAYATNEPRLVYLVEATGTGVELQVVDRNGNPADGILNLVAFRPTREPAPLTTIDRVIVELPPRVIDELPGLIDPGDLIPISPIDTLPGIIVRIPPEDLPELIPEIPPDRLGPILGGLPDDIRGGVIDVIPDPVLPEVIREVPIDSLPDVIGTLPDDRLGPLIIGTRDDRLGDVVTAIPDERLGDVITTLPADRIGDVGAALPADTLAGALIDIREADRGGVIGALGSDTLAGAIVAAPDDARSGLIASAPADALGGAIIAADSDARGVIIADAPAESLGAAVISAPDSTRAELIGAIPSESLAETIVGVSEESRGDLVGVLSDAKLAETIVAAPAETRDGLLDSVSDARLADAVVAAPEGTRTELVGSLSDERVGGVVLATPEASIGVVVASVPAERVGGIIASTSEGSLGTLTDTLALGGRIP